MPLPQLARQLMHQKLRAPDGWRVSGEGEQ
jgi:hypothetical protein